ncbi:hypothetical protein BH11GEM2_BH11GEM2_26070 [soil metagenome]
MTHFKGMAVDNLEVFPGFDQVVVTFRPDAKELDRAARVFDEQPSSGSLNGAASHVSIAPERDHFVTARQLVGRLARLTPRRDDQIIFHSGCTPKFWMNLPRVLVRGRPVTVVVFGTELQEPTAFRGRVLDVLKKLFLPMTQVVCLSEGDAKRFTERFGRPRKLRVIPYCSAQLYQFAAQEIGPNIGPLKIQVGNNAEPVNDHVGCLERLARIEGLDATVVLFLNYCVAPRYVQQVKAEAAKAFRVEAYDALLALSDFDRVVASCDALLVGSHDQRALGSIYRYLLAGRPVFLPARSNIRADLQRSGFMIYALEDLASMSKVSLARLCRVVNERNRNQAAEMLGLSQIRALWRELVGSGSL